MLNNYLEDDKKSKKRTLKKVRWQYIRKIADSNDPGIVDPASWLLNSNTVYVIRSELLLFEKNREIRMDIQQLQNRCNLSTKISHTPYKQKILDLCLNNSEKNNPYLEYSLKRLESFGDLDLAAWAHKIRDYYSNHEKLMKEYFGLLHSQDNHSIDLLKNIRIKAQETIEEIEQNHAFSKLFAFWGKESVQLNAISYNEGFLEYTGFTIETLEEWIKLNGAPQFFEQSKLPFASAAKHFLNALKLEVGPIHFGPEYECLMTRRDGHKIKVPFKFIKILEPREDGFFLHSYFIVNKAKEEQYLKEEFKGVTISKSKKKGCPYHDKMEEFKE